MDKQNEPKIVVDDDWKSQVEDEKEQLRTAAKTGERDDIDPEMPPASIMTLVTTLATQAVATLGQFPDPDEGKPLIRKSLAKHFIDTLTMLEEKTAGNLSEDESAFLTETVHQLRLLYVQTPAAGRAAAGPQTAGPANRPVKSPTIELP